jgi:hypothetical protein
MIRDWNNPLSILTKLRLGECRLVFAVIFAAIGYGDFTPLTKYILLITVFYILIRAALLVMFI